MSKVKDIAKNSISSGSIVAIVLDLKSLFFNLRSLVFHSMNYYSLSRKMLAERRLHFGCGSDYKPGFINLDMNKSADYYFDARNKLHFKDGTIEYIYSSHFVEHLSNNELMDHLKESFRILQVNGILRICVPDFVGSIRAYMQKDYDRLVLRFQINLSIFHNGYRRQFPQPFYPFCIST
jgi:hypothetical protein